jgi:inward rectifier potassium channel
VASPPEAEPPKPAVTLPPRMARTTQPFTDVARIGARRAPLSDLYHQLMDMSWGRLMAFIAVAYTTINTLFALAYLAGGDCIENARPGSFHDAFFFSVQTMATIGYGKLVPRTSYANAMVAFEALCGIVGTAMATGLMFAKFARPTARVLFSRVAVVAKRDGVESLMFRMANERGNQIVEATVRVVFARNEMTREGESMRRFYDLPLSRDRNAVFTLSWTAVHPITPGSYLDGATVDSLAASDTLLIVSLMGLDETSAQTVHARHVYYPEDLRWGERFVDILSRGEDGRRQIDYRVFHDTQPMGE